MTSSARTLPTRLAIGAFAIAVLAAAGCSSSGGPDKASKGGGIDPREFTARVDNPYFPLRPGTTFRYRGTGDSKRTADAFTVMRRAKRVMGVPCVVVRDRFFADGKLAEDTFDWYAQDRRGNVWYFGEATKELDARGRGKSREGSWQAGVDGARPGIFMPARPRVGEAFRQEYYKGHAEDHFRVIGLGASVRVPYGSFRNVLETQEWTPLEPDVVEHKYYARGVGDIKELTVKGPREWSALESVRRAR